MEEEVMNEVMVEEQDIQAQIDSATLALEASPNDMDSIKAIAAKYAELGDVPTQKAIKLAEISAFDASGSVNSFVYNGMSMWIPKELRISLANSSAIEKAAGKTNTTLWFGGVRFELPIAALQQMLAAVELYALECYNVTESHKASVMAMDDCEAIMAYNYEQGYPEKLVF